MLIFYSILPCLHNVLAVCSLSVSYSPPTPSSSPSWIASAQTVLLRRLSRLPNLPPYPPLPYRRGVLTDVCSLPLSPRLNFFISSFFATLLSALQHPQYRPVPSCPHREAERESTHHRPFILLWGEVKGDCSRATHLSWLFPVPMFQPCRALRLYRLPFLTAPTA